MRLHYPTFGSAMSDLAYKHISGTDTAKYRYGFNGEEKDDETNVNGGSYDFGERIYDGRLGRWLSLDPLSIKFPFESHYCYVSNNPIIYKDIEGKSKYITLISIFVDEKGNETSRTTAVVYINDKDLIERKVSKESTIFGISTHDYTNYYEYYDLNEVHTTKYKPDGTIVSTTKEEKKGNLRYTSGLQSKNWANWWMKDSDDDNKFEEGLHGIRWTTSGGTGEGNSYESGGKAIFSDNLDLMLAVLGVNGPGAPTKLLGLKFLSDVVGILSTSHDVNENIIDPLFEKHGVVKKVDADGKATCPSCLEKQDSTHIDAINGAGTYNKTIGKSNDTTTKTKTSTTTKTKTSSKQTNQSNNGKGR